MRANHAGLFTKSSVNYRSDSVSCVLDLTAMVKGQVELATLHQAMDSHHTIGKILCDPFQRD